MRVLLTGAAGQLGQAISRLKPDLAEIVAVDRARLNITDEAAVTAMVAQIRPDIILNTAAYTQVDTAEAEQAAAYAANAQGPRHLARAAAQSGARLIHISTDFVFDGRGHRPYRPDAPTNPVNAYGASKLAGETGIRDILGERALIVRTAWLYGAGGRNFVATMLRLMASRDSLAVVADQVGTPTWTDTLAQTLWALAGHERLGGTYHCTDAGGASWYDFAVAIQDEAVAMGILSRPIPIRPIATADYPTPARRPAYSVLDKSETWQLLGAPAAHWRHGLRHMLADTLEDVNG